MLNDNDNYGYLPEYDPYTLFTDQFEPVLKLEFEETSLKPKELDSGFIQNPEEF